MMSRIVELVGPPGVGKSTLYGALCAAWTPASPWTHQDALLSPAKPSISQVSAWLEYNVKVMLGRRRTKSIPVDFGLRFSDLHNEFAHFCWNHLSTSGVPLNQEIGQRFRSSYFLFNDFCRYQAILEKPSKSPCIIEEGFLQKSFLLHDNGSQLEELLKSYLRLIPLPQAILLIDSANTDLIVKRLRQRKKTIASHLQADDRQLAIETRKWQQLLQFATSALEKNGVQVYRLDAELPVRENVAMATRYLGQLN
jgi:energy-coupling factor transporter ATP-binding protein EcfA2